MSFRRVFASLLHLLVVFIFFGAGFFCMTIPYLPEWQMRLADLFVSHVDECVRFGFYLFGLSLFFLLSFYWLHRGKYLEFTMGRHVIELREKAIRDTIETFLKEHHPKLTLTDLDIVKKSRLDLQVTIRPSENPEQIEELLKQVEEDLAKLFYDCFGYKRSFALSLYTDRI